MVVLINDLGAETTMNEYNKIWIGSFYAKTLL